MSVREQEEDKRQNDGPQAETFTIYSMNTNVFRFMLL